jgi:phospholipid N-methyltransferase
VVLGRSLAAHLHPVAVEAVCLLIESRSGQRPIGRSIARPASVDANMYRHLADWLLDVNSNGPYSLQKQTPYLFTSGAQRAKAIATALQHTAHRTFECVIDVGSGVGMIPWLLHKDFPSIRAVDLVEPMRHFRPALDRLWHDRCRRSDYTVRQAKAEEVEFTATDLIMFSHCLLLIAPEQRSTVLDRAWNALNPGGVLMVNETFRDASTPSPKRPDIVHRDELIDILPGDSRIFTRKTGWRKGQPLDSVTARAVGHTGVIVAVRRNSS